MFVDFVNNHKELKIINDNFQKNIEVESIDEKICEQEAKIDNNKTKNTCIESFRTLYPKGILKRNFIEQNKLKSEIIFEKQKN